MCIPGGHTAEVSGEIRTCRMRGTTRGAVGLQRGDTEERAEARFMARSTAAQPA